MKRVLLYAAIIGFFSHFAQAQSFVDYENDNRIFFGINLGTTWHCQTEVDNQFRAGVSMHFGQSFFMQPNNFFSLDYRIKFAFKRYQGQSIEKFLLDSNQAEVYPDYFFGLDNYEKNLGYFIPNFRTDLFSAAFELVLNTNRLRQNTGVNLYLFGGLDLTSYNVTADLASDTLSYYQYNQLNNPKKSDILEFQNGDYSDNLFEKPTTLIPSLGFGISYQFTRTFALSFEHKTLFPGHNQFDGLDKVYSSTQITTQNDIIHFTSIGVKFHILRSHINYEDDSPYDYRYKPDKNPLPDTRNNNNPDPIPDGNPDPIDNEVIDNPQPPIINFTNPMSSPHSTEDYIFPIKAEVKYVSTRENIIFKVNGDIMQNYAFNPQLNDFKSSIVLKDGSNLVEIKAVNPYGEDYETVIIYIKEEKVLNPPIVNIINPATSPQSVENDDFSFKAEALNIDNNFQISFLFNGKAYSNFNFNSTTKGISASLKLKEGRNEVIIKAQNQDGSDAESAIIIYSKKQNITPPAVQIISPDNNAVFSTENIEIKANSLNVFSENDVTLSLNKTLIGSFIFDRNTQKISTLVELKEGSNIFKVDVKNQFGSASDIITIIYRKAELKNPPFVNFVVNAKQINSSSQNYSVNAKTENISHSDIILLKQNNISIPKSDLIIDKDFNIKYQSTLADGKNEFDIYVQNKDGSASDKLFVFYEAEKPCDKPILKGLSKNNISTTDASSNIKISTQFIDNKSQISIKSNGKLIPFNFNSNIISINSFKLVYGINLIEVKAENECGDAVLVYNITREKCLKPQIIDLKPSNNSSTNFDKILISGSILNYDASTSLKLLHNGLNQVLIKVNSTNITFKEQIQLKEGHNKISIIVSNDCGENKYDLNVLYSKKKPCENPVLSEISKNNFTTNKNHTVVKAAVKNISDKSEISVSINGSNMPFDFFKNIIEVQNIKLSEGDNLIKINAQNDCGKDELIYKIHYEKCNPPQIVEISNENDFSTEKAQENISGKTAFAYKSDIQILVNGSPMNFDFNQKNEIFNTDLNLKMGLNTIQIIVSNKCGTAKKSFVITRKEACQPLKYVLVSPNSLKTSTDNKSTDFTLKTSNIKSQHDVSIKFNGANTSFKFVNGEINIVNLQLKEGNNKIEVDLKNECSSEKLIFNIDYKACVPPEIKYSGALSTTEKEFTFIAQVLNVKNQNDISLFVNNKQQPFSYNNITKYISSKMELNNGNNSVRIIAKGCKSSTETYTIKFSDKPCKTITYELSSPANLNSTINSNKYDFAIAVFEVENISLKLNGQNINYNHSNNLITASNLNLKIGLNIIQLDLSNDCSSKSFTYKITVVSPKPEPKGPYYQLEKESNTFCMQTAKEEITDEFLRKNPNYKFSGVANSLYFKAADGGGKARVNRKQINIVPGTYYHFTGKITVSMIPKREKGKIYWEIVIISNTPPKGGFGAKQPPNPCEKEIKKRSNEVNNMRRR